MRASNGVAELLRVCWAHPISSETSLLPPLCSPMPSSVVCGH
jgi:hypothetical protein